ncbi:hypothetical protein BSU04_02005 [Caballeronia sordidicola]|uniref:Uncharacterized protein n=2 Tax=Caballeronia sordidicola TaxID=196367 RepID=A0A226XBQ6_CABSO|nr:hypothetical protein BSU04_02005 [Caballeronia sordidicola]
MPALKGEVLVMLYLTDVEMFEISVAGRKFEQRNYEPFNFGREPC